jgi:streptomycin 6-kinase
LFQRARDDRNAGRQTDYVDAAILADRLTRDTTRLRGLHGDLHRENIRTLDIDPRRLLDQAFCYGCLSAAWNVEGDDESQYLHQRWRFETLRLNH